MYNKEILLLKYLLLSILSILYGCSSSEEPAVDQELIDDKIISDYILANNIIAEKDTSGIYFEKIMEIQPPVKVQTINDNILTLHYTAKVLEGVGIDSTSATTGPDSVKVKQGVGAIFPVGLDRGLALMTKGETFKFFIPSHLAFKNFSSSLPAIPANSILEITVELIEIENDAEQLAGEILLIENYITVRALNDTITNPLDSVVLLPSGEYYKRISAGIQNDTLITGEPLNLQYMGTFLNDPLNPFASGVLDYNFATGIVIQGLDSGVSKMERLESALIIIPSQRAYKESAFYFPRSLGSDFVNELFIPNYATEVPPFSVLVFDVTLQ